MHINQKRKEYRHLAYFVEAAKFLAGTGFEIVSESERPDFICKRETGERVGIELTQITRGDPSIIDWDRIINRRSYMKSYDAIERICALAEKKNTKRQESNWSLSSATILLFQLTDIPICRLKSRIGEWILEDFHSMGFVEVWAADYTGLEAYQNVELFGLYPKRVFGYYPRPPQKPFG